MPVADGVHHSGRPHVTTQEVVDVEVSQTRDRAKLVTDDVTCLREQLEAATCERIPALEGIEAVEKWTFLQTRPRPRDGSNVGYASRNNGKWAEQESRAEAD